MSGPPLRFLQTGSLRLGQPLGGLPEVPDHLRDLLLDAPYEAAARVFETALREDVDFVLLAGDVLDPQTAGARAISFLLDQLQLLKERHIMVYWVGGRADVPGRWPSELQLPENVLVYPQGHVQEHTHHRGGEPVALILGSSHDHQRRLRVNRFQPSNKELFAVGLAYCRKVPQRLAQMSIRYWALGGQHERCTPLAEPSCTAHYAGTPQGHCLAEVEAHGCTLVHVDENGQVRLQPITTDQVRWQQIDVSLSDQTSSENVERLLCDRVEALRSQAGPCPLIVQWILSGNDHYVSDRHRRQLAADLLGRLRARYGYAAPVVWSSAVEVTPLSNLPRSWYREETILGDFLRTLDEHRRGELELSKLTAYLATPEDPALEQVRLLQNTSPDRLLDEVALLATELLRGEASAQREIGS